MNTYTHINTILQKLTRQSSVEKAAFYKTGPGQYAEHDQFIGVSVPMLRRLAKEFKKLPLSETHHLLKSPINEERLLALFIIIHQYNRASPSEKEIIYQFYRSNLIYINNWNLVDASAHLILGAHLFKTNKEALLILAKSQKMWERRIAIVSTWHFIRNNDLEWTFKLAKILLNDTHDLIHKAVGWMLREAGKHDQTQLIAFLDQYVDQMPRTMLRYSIEKFPDDKRKAYLSRKKSLLYRI